MSVLKIWGKCDVNREKVSKLHGSHYFTVICQSGNYIVLKVQMFSVLHCQIANSWYIWKPFFLRKNAHRVKLYGLRESFIFIMKRLKIFIRGQEKKMQRLYSCDALTSHQTMHLSRNWHLCSYKNNYQIQYWKTHKNLRFNHNSKNVKIISPATVILRI